MLTRLRSDTRDLSLDAQPAAEVTGTNQRALKRPVNPQRLVPIHELYDIQSRARGIVSRLVLAVKREPE